MLMIMKPILEITGSLNWVVLDNFEKFLQDGVIENAVLNPKQYL